MKRVPLIVTWMLGATLLASAQTSFFYPHVVDGVLGGTIWKTTIFLTNPSSQPPPVRSLSRKTITTLVLPVRRGRSRWRMKRELRRPRVSSHLRFPRCIA